MTSSLSLPNGPICGHVKSLRSKRIDKILKNGLYSTYSRSEFILLDFQVTAVLVLEGAPAVHPPQQDFQAVLYSVHEALPEVLHQVLQSIQKCKTVYK